MRFTHLNPNKIMRVAVTMAIRRIPFTTGPEAPLQLSEEQQFTSHLTPGLLHCGMADGEQVSEVLAHPFAYAL